MHKRKPRVVEWNSCIDVPFSRGILVHVLLLDRYTRPAEKRGTAHADLLVGAQVLADQCKQSAGESVWVSWTFSLFPCSGQKNRFTRNEPIVTERLPSYINYLTRALYLGSKLSWYLGTNNMDSVFRGTTSFNDLTFHEWTVPLAVARKAAFKRPTKLVCQHKHWAFIQLPSGSLLPDKSSIQFRSSSRLLIWLFRTNFL